MPSPESPANLMMTRSSCWTCLVTAECLLCAPRPRLLDATAFAVRRDVPSGGRIQGLGAHSRDPVGVQPLFPADLRLWCRSEAPGGRAGGRAPCSHTITRRRHMVRPVSHAVLAS